MTIFELKIDVVMLKIMIFLQDEEKTCKIE